MMRRYAIFSLLPLLVVGQQRIPGADINVVSFDSVDTNRDGVIDAREYSTWSAKHLAYMKSEQRKKLFTTSDTDGDGVLIVAEFVPFAYAISQKPPLSSTQSVFNRLDRNGDGVLDASERTASGIDSVVLSGLLTVADSNGDGLLSRQEFDAALDTTRPRTQEEKNRETALELLSNLDANKDRHLSVDEVKTFAAKFGKANDKDVKAAFAALDENRDGLLDVHELAHFPAKISALFPFEAPPPVRATAPKRH